MNGYAGKILRIDLTRKKISHINTSDYEEWVGGHGMGSAIFFDLVKDKKISGFDPGNVVTIMTSPLTGTLAPGGASRTEMQGIGVQSYPVEWFTRSNVGGRFGPMLKYAGWDGIVIEGRAEKPVWIDIRNDDVEIRNAGSLWGLDTWETQEKIWNHVTGGSEFGDWIRMGDKNTDGRSTQIPAVMAIGQAGENLARVAAVIHDAGNAAGQGGFGGVWGSKNLKAISVIGTGSIKVADPGGLLQARLWAKRNYSLNIDDPADLETMLMGGPTARTISSVGTLPAPAVFWKVPSKSRPQACMGCPAGCRIRTESGMGNESQCMETAVYTLYDIIRHTSMKTVVNAGKITLSHGPARAFAHLMWRGQTPAARKATDMLQKYGINAFEFGFGISYLIALRVMGKLGPGKEIDTDLPFKELGEVEFAQKLFKSVAYREGIGNDLAEGFARAAKKWGRLEQDLKTGLLMTAYWGLPDHFDPRFQIEWGYGSVLGDRDINEHGFNILFWIPLSRR